MNPNYHVVPWYNSEEWHKVYSEISNADSNKEEALKLLLVWKARSPSLPSGIESTLSLLQVHVEDTKTSHDAHNDQLLRLAYSSAIMRFVNHMLDTETEKGTSLYKAAKSLGVPDWIVDLRHDTAHSNTLPPITLLREACTISLQWLQTNYWDKHQQYIQDYVCGQKDDLNGDGDKISALMNFYISLGICAHSKLKIKTLAEIPNVEMQESIVNDIKDLLGDLIDLSDLSTVSIMSLINIMNTHSKKLLKVKEVSTLVNEALLGQELQFLSRDLLFFFSASDFKYRNKLYGSYVQCFEVLLTFLHTNDLLLDFIMALIKLTQPGQKCLYKARLAALWVSEILVALKNTKTFIIKYKKMSAAGEKSKKKDLKQLYHLWFPNNGENNLMLDLQKGVPSELQDIDYIQPIITEYNLYLSYFIRDLLNLLEPSLPMEVVNRLCTLTRAISSPDKFPVNYQTSATIYTADDLRMSLDDVVVVDDVPNNDTNIEQVEQDDGQIINSIWKLASNNHNWGACPIGQVPWTQELDSESN